MEHLLPFIHHHWALVALLAFIFIVIIGFESFMKTREAKEIDAQSAIHLINQEKAPIIDVRPKEAYQAGHIIGALNVPMADLATSMKKLEKYKNKFIVLVCDNAQVSQKAAKELGKLKFTQVKILKGGLDAWNKEHLPLESK